MDQNKMENQQFQPVYYEEDEIDLLDLLIVLAKRKKLIFGMTFLFGILSIAYVLLVPPIYRASARILPPAASASKMAMLSQIPSFASDALGIKTPGDLIVGIANSRTVKDQIIEKYDLKTKFEAENMDGVRETLSGMTSANTDSKTGIVSISVEDKDPVFAAQLANSYVDELRAFMQKLAISDAAQQRLFLEEQVKETQINLLQAENELAEYQKKTGILNAGQQASALMSAIATFRARISAKEVELKTAQTFASANNPRIQQLRAEIASLKEEMGKLEEKASTGTNGSFSMSELPDAGLEYLRKLRDQKFYETLYEMLLKQLETARMAEAQEPSIIQVIDEAVPPQVKAKPKRKQVVVLATVLGFFLSIFLAFIFEFVEKAGLDPERKGKLDTLRHYLRIREKKR